jgi:hypothetical protein
MRKWEGKQHSGSIVFVVARIVDSDIADMRVFSTLQDATVDALHMMVNEHPEAFALPRTTDDDGNEVKPPKVERATSVIRDIAARPDFMQVPRADVVIDRANGNQYVGSRSADNQYTSSQSAGTQHATHRNTGEQTMGPETDVEDSLFVIKPETPEWPRQSRIAQPQPYLNDRGEMLLGDGPEPIYVFWGRYKISSFCLKMEARRVDGAAIKVSVHLKNLRKPDHV